MIFALFTRYAAAAAMMPAALLPRRHATALPSLRYVFHVLRAQRHAYHMLPLRDMPRARASRLRVDRHRRAMRDCRASAKHVLRSAMALRHAHERGD